MESYVSSLYQSKDIVDVLLGLVSIKATWSRLSSRFQQYIVLHINQLIETYLNEKLIRKIQKNMVIDQQLDKNFDEFLWAAACLRIPLHEYPAGDRASVLNAINLRMEEAVDINSVVLSVGVFYLIHSDDILHSLFID